jgi:outer membrane protein TolC
LAAWDLNLTNGTQINPSGYYNGWATQFMLEQNLPLWGAQVYGGYRLSGGFLANYDKNRTQEDGEWIVGMKVNLLRDGVIDRRRVAIGQARLDMELAQPIILRQYLDFIRAAAFAYGQWTAAGKRLQVTEELLKLAQQRQEWIQLQIQAGAVADIVNVDNLRLVINRQLMITQAQRRFEQAALELSLFWRDDQEAPQIAKREQLPEKFPLLMQAEPSLLDGHLSKAYLFRPELRRLELSKQKLEWEKRLARNALLPNVDLSLEAINSKAVKREKDIEKNEIAAKLDFKMPLQQSEARGRIEVATAQMQRLQLEQQFAKDRIEQEVKDAFSALAATGKLLELAEKNVYLSQQLEVAEWTRVQQGSSDLLNLQIREQATFDARLMEIEAKADQFRASIQYRTAIAADAPSQILGKTYQDLWIYQQNIKKQK